MWLLTWRDLQFRRWRVLTVTALIAVVMTLLFLMFGLVGQFQSEPYLATERAGDGRNWLVAEGSTGPFTAAQPVPREVVASIPDAVPVLVGRGALDDLAVILVGRDLAALPEPGVTEGRLPTGPGEVMADPAAEVEIGDDVTLSGLPATVVGLVDEATVFAGIPMVFVTLEFAQAALAAEADVVTGALVEGVPADIPPGMMVMTDDEVGDNALVPLEGALSSIDLVRVLLWLITAIVIAAVTYITALERTRDVAVLKAVGGRGRSLSFGLILQAVLMTLAATVLAAGLQRLASPLFPLGVRLPASAWWQVPLGGAIISVFAALLGVRKVTTTPPQEAFG